MADEISEISKNVENSRSHVSENHENARNPNINDNNAGRNNISNDFLCEMMKEAKEGFPKSKLCALKSEY